MRSCHATRHAWERVLPHYLARLAGFIDRFHELRSRDQAPADLADVARAVVAGRIDTLLLDAGRQVPGRMDTASGAITLGESNDPRVDDLLDDPGGRVLMAGGEVIVVPTERMPTDSGLAAIHRFRWTRRPYEFPGASQRGGSRCGRQRAAARNFIARKPLGIRSA